MRERRKEPRVEVDAPAVMTPLAAVATRVNGQVLNVSTGGLRVRVPKSVLRHLRVGEVFRIHSTRDLMLCEVCYAEPRNEGTDIGFRIVYWSAIGELNRAVKSHKSSARP
jgi:hypothetical protein